MVQKHEDGQQHGSIKSKAGPKGFAHSFSKNNLSNDDFSECVFLSSFGVF